MGEWRHVAIRWMLMGDSREMVVEVLGVVMLPSLADSMTRLVLWVRVRRFVIVSGRVRSDGASVISPRIAVLNPLPTGRHSLSVYWDPCRRTEERGRGREKGVDVEGFDRVHSP